MMHSGVSSYAIFPLQEKKIYRAHIGVSTYGFMLKLRNVGFEMWVFSGVLASSAMALPNPSWLTAAL